MWSSMWKLSDFFETSQYKKPVRHQKLLNSGFLGNLNPHKTFLVYLRCPVDGCVFIYPTFAGYCVLLTDMGLFEEILFVVKVWLSGPVPGGSKVG